MIWICYGTVIKVRDGDTFVTDLDLGWRVWVKSAETGTGYGVVRVLNLYCPELREPGGKEAKAFAESLLPIGSVVKLESHDLDAFGRSLCVVTVSPGTVSEVDFATEMIKQGYGKVNR